MSTAFKKHIVLLVRHLQKHDQENEYNRADI